VFSEQKHNVSSAPGLAVENSLVLRYPFASFFYISPNRPDLYDAIRTGIERAHADGSYWELLTAHPSVRPVLKAANLEGRRVIEIDNPTLSEKTRSIPEKYWFHVGS